MKYTALIVTFNRLGKLKKTVEETLKLEFTNIVIVNNGSTDGTQAWLSSIVDTRVIVLTLTENTGGAGGFKTGSQYICEQLASDWVFFYDDDAYPYPDTLKSFSQLDKRGCRVFLLSTEITGTQPSCRRCCTATCHTNGSQRRSRKSS